MTYRSGAKLQIKRWLHEAKKEKATHMLVVCDTFSHEDYPVNITMNEDLNAEMKRYNGINMQRIMEVYDLRMDINKQLGEDRAYNTYQQIDMKNVYDAVFTIFKDKSKAATWLRTKSIFFNKVSPNKMEERGQLKRVYNFVKNFPKLVILSKRYDPAEFQRWAEYVVAQLDA